MSGCELSSSASAFSSLISAFFGAIFSGLCGGYFIACFTAWLSWFAVIRILAAGCYELYHTIKIGTNISPPTSDEAEYQSIEMNVLNGAGTRSSGYPTDVQPLGVGHEQAHPDPQMDPVQAHMPNPRNFPFGTRSYFKAFFKEPKRDVTPFGWLGWVWSAIYTPISQSIWVSVHARNSPGPTHLVRALAIGVSALALTFDHKQRYAAFIGRKRGPWASVAFNTWNSTACLLLGAEATFLLIRGAVKVSASPKAIIIYSILSIIWAAMSWHVIPPIDGSRQGWNRFLDLWMGFIAGLVCAVPAFVLWKQGQSDSSSGGMDLGNYLNCEGATFWDKFAAVMP